MDSVGVDCACAVSVASHGAPSMTGVVAELEEKEHTANGGVGFWNLRCIIHEEAVCRKSLKMDHAMEVVKTVNFICVKGRTIVNLAIWPRIEMNLTLLP